MLPMLGLPVPMRLLPPAMLARVAVVGHLGQGRAGGGGPPPASASACGGGPWPPECGGW